MSSEPFEIPEGFAEDNGRGPFTRHNGPIYRRFIDDQHEVGLRVLERHCNGMGFLHGGMASAFADGALAWAVWHRTRQASVTMRLTLDYLQTVRLGDWLVARPQVIGVDDQIVHVEAELFRNDKQLSAKATAVFHLIRKKLNS